MRFASRSSTRQTTHLNSDKKVNSKPSETGRSLLNRLANRPVILRTAAYFEFLFLLYLPSIFAPFCFGRRFIAPSFFTAAKTIFHPYSSMTLLPENVKNPRKTYFNPFTLFRFRGIKPSATATDKAIRTHHTNPEKTKTTAHRQPKNADKTLFFAKEKPKSNTLVFDLGFDWRKERDSLRSL